jgi:ribosomal peptide maturation radical SAM protein 1
MTKNIKINNDYSNILTDADVLLIVPPFEQISRPSQGVHILQECAKKNGITVDILYVNIAFATEITDVENYELLASTYDYSYLLEVIFSQYAYDTAPFYDIKKYEDFLSLYPKKVAKSTIKMSMLMDTWINTLVSEIVKRPYKIVGSTTTFLQTNSSIAFLKHIKSQKPDIVTILGGAACHNELSNGILKLCNQVDYVFSGESEITFPKFVKNIMNGQLPKNKIIYGEMCDINEIPIPDYSQYLKQLKFFVPENTSKQFFEKIAIQYETSRGCWWGQKHKCTFCGLIHHEIKYRVKPPDKVFSELKYLVEKYKINNILTTDSIMPINYFKDLFPKIAKELKNLNLFYETKANIKFEQLLLMKKAGITFIQPGIESLSTEVLKRMNKGVDTKQNIMLLRNAKSLQVTVYWNILYGFPGEANKDYEGYKKMASLIPLIVHFTPPNGFSKVKITRFSSYYNFYQEYGIKNLRPDPRYQYSIPKDSKIRDVAFDFEGDYESILSIDAALVDDINKKVEMWKSLWEKENDLPMLRLIEVENGYSLIDTRGLTEVFSQSISEKQAIVIMNDRPISKIGNNEVDNLTKWALELNLIVEIDSWYVSLITAEPALISKMKDKYQQQIMSSVGRLID